MHRLSICVAIATVMLGACKGKTTFKDKPETIKAITDCQTALKDKDTLIASLQKKVLEGGEDVVVNIEGEAMKITGEGPSGRGGTPRGNADDAKLYEAFVAALRSSKGSLEKCYQSALKNNATLQGRPVTLNIQVGYKTSGQVADAQFSPRIDSSFTQCMGAVARRWTLPAMPRAVTFNYKQTLTPQ